MFSFQTRSADGDIRATTRLRTTECNVLRVLLRLAKDVKALDTKKLVTLQEIVDEIGRMLGGWIKSVKE